MYNIIDNITIKENCYIRKIFTVKGEPKNDYYVVTVLIN
jgi:hypothetical protein